MPACVVAVVRSSRSSTCHYASTADSKPPLCRLASYVDATITRLWREKAAALFEASAALRILDCSWRRLVQLKLSTHFLDLCCLLFQLVRQFFNSLILLLHSPVRFESFRKGFLVVRTSLSLAGYPRKEVQVELPGRRVNNLARMGV
jgi:hypothetical protein